MKEDVEHGASLPRLGSITLSVFVSSPQDLKSTRETARAVINGLSGSIIEGTRVEFKALLYEDITPAVVGYPPQEAVDAFMGRSDQANIFVGMFWSRMGTAAVVSDRRQSSGSRYEFERAYKKLRKQGTPWMLLYRCTRVPVPPDATDTGMNEVDQFFDSFRGNHPRYEGLPQDFVTNEDFASQLEHDILIVTQRLVLGGRGNPLEPRAKALGPLVSSVRQWLATFEDLPRERIPHSQGAERDRSFRIGFRSVVAGKSSTSKADEIRPRNGELLLDVFDDCGGRLLMIGERGTGKTFSLLQLIQDLADRAHIRPGESVPVFFNLSSWQETHSSPAWSTFGLLRLPWGTGVGNQEADPTLDEWLEDQLVRNYSMQRRAARSLIGRNEIIICLDGLDELGPTDGGETELSHENALALREACVRAINATLENRAVRMILCCRDETYRELTVKPTLGMTLETQRLTLESVIEELQLWPRLDGLRLAAGESKILAERARIALFLGMMRIAYEDVPANTILSSVQLSPSEWERDLLDRYVDRCMKLAPPGLPELDKRLIDRCLSWMARMPSNELLLEDLQPGVLRPDNSVTGKHSWRTFRVLSVLALAVSLTILETFPTGLSQAITHGASEGIRAGIKVCLATWIISATVLLPLYLVAFSARSWWRYGLSFGLAWALDTAVVILFAVPGEVKAMDGTWPGAIHMFLVSLPCACLFFSIMGVQHFSRLEAHKRKYATRQDMEYHEIMPIDPMHWTWYDRNHPWCGGWIGVLVGPFALLVGWMAGEWARGLIAVVIVTLITTLFAGLAGTGPARISTAPNQGMVRSLRHALRMTLLCVVVGSITWGTIHYVREGWVHGVAGIFLGLTLSFAFYLSGGWPVVQQWCLGEMLHRQGRLPTWRCWPPWRATVSFLDELVRYKLLRRSAGGYMFRHQSIREYYAGGTRGPQRTST